MKSNKTQIGSFELGSILVNLLVFKILTGFPKQFFRISGSGGLLSALFGGLVFLGVLFLLLTLYQKRDRTSLFDLAETHLGKPGLVIVSLLLLAYLLFSGFYALRNLVAILRIVSYPTTPVWFLVAFLGLSALVIAVRGKSAVFRLHTIMTWLVCAAIVWIVLSSLKYADFYHLFPILGTGAGNVFGRGLSGLFLYSDILVLFLIAPHCREGVRVRRTTMWSALIAVVLNVAVVFASQLSTPSELAANISLPMYPLTKVTYSGKVFQRLDAVYLIVSVVSGLLYLSLMLRMIGKTVKKMAFKPKKAAALLLCLVLMVSLCGCYDSREVEESAYVIALGIDKGETARFRYTFQFSNPLSTGANSGSAEKPESEGESKEDGKKEENTSVNNITLDADDYYMALNTLNSFIGKIPSLAHIKLIAFSPELAKEGLLEHTRLLINEREVRPNTWLCIAGGSPDELLKGIKPSLEESTARYYELLLQEKTAPYAPVVELREFVNRASDNSTDAVLPIIGQSELIGICLFSGDQMMVSLGGEEALLYKLLTGKADNVYLSLGGTTYRVSNLGQPKISVNLAGDVPQIGINLKLNLHPISKNQIDTSAVTRELSDRINQFLAVTTTNNCDVLGIRQRIKAGCLTQAAWDSRNKPGMYTNSTFSLNIDIKEDNGTETFQNY